MGMLEEISARLERIEEKLEALVDLPVTTPVVKLEEAQRWFDTKQAAAYIGMSHQSLSLWRSKGEGPAFSKISGTVRYDRQELDAWMDKHKRGMEN